VDEQSEEVRSGVGSDGRAESGSSPAPTAFVLTGGGNLGAVQVGMLQALLEHGIVPDLVVGTSIGALNGAFLVGHAHLSGITGLRELWESVRREDVFPMHAGSLTRGLLGHQPYLFDSLGVRTLLLRADLGFSRLEEAPIPLAVVATDLHTGEAVVLKEGDVIQAVLASSAIPGVFPPVSWEGRILVDGGVSANAPVMQAEEWDPAHVYVLPTTPEETHQPPANAIVMMQRALALATGSATRQALIEASERRAVHVLPVPKAAEHLSIFDFKVTRRLIEESYALAEEWISAAAEQSQAAAARQWVV
jgi:NTE family protein